VLELELLKSSSNLVTY